MAIEVPLSLRRASVSADSARSSMDAASSFF
jgi:hypothetical protein